jgi:hypothetical protein
MPNAELNLESENLKNLIRRMNQNWAETGTINPHAIPYIQYLLEGPEDMDLDWRPEPHFESARDLVPYLLNNAMTWRGPTARAVKKELLRRYHEK